MKKKVCFILINVLIVTSIQILFCVINASTSLELTYKISYITITIIFLGIPLYLFIIGQIFSYQNNNLIIFLIIYISNILTYLINKHILDKIFQIPQFPPNADNIMFFVFTTLFHVMIFSVLLFMRNIVRKTRKY